MILKEAYLQVISEVSKVHKKLSQCNEQFSHKLPLKFPEILWFKFVTCCFYFNIMLKVMSDSAKRAKRIYVLISCTSTGSQLGIRVSGKDVLASLAKNVGV